MFPDNSQNQPGAPANLPVAPAQPPQGGQVPAAAAPAPMPAGSVPDNEASAKAKQLITQYQHDPYTLSEELQRVKSAYLAEHFHISPNPGAE